DLLLHRGAFLLLERGEADRPSFRRGTVERADDSHVGEALASGRLRPATRDHAFREPHYLSRDLVAFREGPARLLLSDRELERLGVRELVSVHHENVALRSDDPVRAVV